MKNWIAIGERMSVCKHGYTSVFGVHRFICPFCEIDRLRKELEEKNDQIRKEIDRFTEENVRLTEEVKKLHDDNEYLILTLEDIIKHQELMAGPWLSKHSVVIFLAQRALDKIRGRENE